jgi:hypothetical protein
MNPLISIPPLLILFIAIAVVIFQIILWLAVLDLINAATKWLNADRYLKAAHLRQRPSDSGNQVPLAAKKFHSRSETWGQMVRHNTWWNKWWIKASLALLCTWPLAGWLTGTWGDWRLSGMSVADMKEHREPIASLLASESTLLWVLVLVIISAAVFTIVGKLAEKVERAGLDTVPEGSASDLKDKLDPLPLRTEKENSERNDSEETSKPRYEDPEDERLANEAKALREKKARRMAEARRRREQEQQTWTEAAEGDSTSKQPPLLPAKYMTEKDKEILFGDRNKEI